MERLWNFVMRKAPGYGLELDGQHQLPLFVSKGFVIRFKTGSFSAGNKVSASGRARALRNELKKYKASIGMRNKLSITVTPRAQPGKSVVELSVKPTN